MDPQRLDKTLWPQVGLIRSYFPSLNGWFAVGTGTLINRRAILTAAHVIHDPTRGGPATKFEVFFGGGAAATAAGTNGRVLPEWVAANSLDPLSAYDAGVILLDPTNVVGGVATAGVFAPAAQAVVINDLLGHNVNVVGYPIRPDFYNDAALAGGESSPFDMLGPPWNGYRIAYPTASLPGMSGGPVYRTDEISASFTIRAVNTSIYNGFGNGLMIYPDLAAQIGNWLLEVP
jgi:V8-like Glu-specific endopeptidase